MTADHPTPARPLDLDEIGRHLDRLSQPPASGPNAFWQLRHDRDHAIGTASTLLAELARRDAALADLTRQRDEARAELDQVHATHETIDALAAELASAEVERDEARMLQAMAEDRAALADAAVGEYGRVLADRDKAEAQLAATKDAIVELIKEQVRLIEQRDEARADAERMRGWLLSANNELNAASAERDRLRLQAGSGEVEIDQLRADVTHLRTERDAALFDRDEEIVDREAAQRARRRAEAKVERQAPVIEAAREFVGFIATVTMSLPPGTMRPLTRLAVAVDAVGPVDPEATAQPAGHGEET